MRTVVTREPEWDEQEQAWMLALRQYRSQVGKCGHYLPETTAPGAEERYTSPEPYRCQACAAAQRAMKAHADDEHATSLLFFAERR